MIKLHVKVTPIKGLLEIGEISGKRKFDKNKLYEIIKILNPKYLEQDYILKFRPLLTRTFGVGAELWHKDFMISNDSKNAIILMCTSLPGTQFRNSMEGDKYNEDLYLLDNRTISIYGQYIPEYITIPWYLYLMHPNVCHRGTPRKKYTQKFSSRELYHAVFNFNWSSDLD